MIHQILAIINKYENFAKHPYNFQLPTWTMHVGIYGSFSLSYNQILAINSF